MSKQTGLEQDSFLSQLFFVNKQKLPLLGFRNIARWAIWLGLAAGITAVMVFFPWSWPFLVIGYKVLIPALVVLTELLVVALVNLAKYMRGRSTKLSSVVQVENQGNTAYNFPPVEHGDAVLDKAEVAVAGSAASEQQVSSKIALLSQ